MAFYARRQRLAEHAEMLANGAAPWTIAFNETVRTKLRYAFIDATPDRVAQYEKGRRDCAELARHWVLRDEGLASLAGWTSEALTDLIESYGAVPDSLLPSIIEAAGVAIDQFQRNTPSDGRFSRERYERAVHDALNEHFLAYDYIFPVVVARDSQELHEEVVAPTLRLLWGNPTFEHVEAAYQKALKEIGTDPADSITDAATALQEMLRVIGAKGGSLGQMAKHARNTGLLAGHDELLVSTLVNWVEADRSATGDAHNALPAAREDAWLTVHVTGALIRRLAAGNRVTE